jgi:hypothetical protein
LSKSFVSDSDRKLSDVGKCRNLRQRILSEFLGSDRILLGSFALSNVDCDCDCNRDYSSNGIEDFIDDSVKPDEILFDL